jgi:hypothetical protein
MSIIVAALATGLTALSAAECPVDASNLGRARQPDGKAGVAITGELKQWHTVTLTLDGPQATETDTDPNPFTDYRMDVTFAHESGTPRYTVPGYFAADGRAGTLTAPSIDDWLAVIAKQ